MKNPKMPHLEGSRSAGLGMCWYKEENVSFPEMPITLYFFQDQKWVIPSSSYLLEDTYNGSKLNLSFTVCWGRVFVMPITAFNDLLGQHNKTTRKGFRLDLHHRDSGKNLGKHELLKRALQREKVRLQRFKAMTKTTSSSSSAQAPLYSDLNEGEYLTNISLGTPPVPCILVMDTGSDLIWTQCKACNPCFDEPSVPFDPTSSSTYKLVNCNDTACTSLPSYSCDSNNSCKYDYSYGGGFDQQGSFGRDTISVPSGTYPGVNFGCATYSQGAFPVADGILGCGDGPQSIVSQLSADGQVPNMFSYCLVTADSDSTGWINVGSYELPDNVGNVIKTPMDQANCAASTFTCVSVT
ncbi:Aspartic proteinase nepenthesin-2-like protein, partial [Drosera capensis]